MYIENPEKLDAKSILNKEVFDEILTIESDFDRESTYFKMRARAKELGVTKQFENLYNSMRREYMKAEKLERVQSGEVMGAGLTDFNFLQMQYRCGDWTANDEGVGLTTENGYRVVCPHPIVPVKILRNNETNKYKIELIFKIRGNVRRLFVDRDVIASPSKILALANDSIQVTSLTAPLLVQYLSDVERLGSADGAIQEYVSTSRLGWIEVTDEKGNRKKYFLPYEQDIVFDNELSMKVLYDSIRSFGDREKWYKLIKSIRSKRQNEVLINLAASFASVLVDIYGSLPFIVSLWGGSGIGKSVILKICTSVWADPGEGKYIADAKATYTAMEIRLNILNSLPMMLDDMAQIQYQEDNFNEVIYRWCAGRGRDRSNKELGLNKLTSWRNCTITNGERSLVDESSQGGAINRVIDIEASGDKLFKGKEGNKTVNIIEKNFGFAGKEFIKVIQSIEQSEIESIVNKYFDRIIEAADKKGVKKEDKQVVPMALILAADELTEKYLFQDGVLLDVEECCNYLKDQNDSSEGIRAYEYLISVVMSNKFRFEDDPDRPGPKWGSLDEKENLVTILSTEFDRIVGERFQSKAFLSWAKKNDLLKLDKNGNAKKVVRFEGQSVRAVVIKTDFLDENGGFMDVEGVELPFE